MSKLKGFQTEQQPSLDEIWEELKGKGETELRAQFYALLDVDSWKPAIGLGGVVPTEEWIFTIGESDSARPSLKAHMVPLTGNVRIEQTTPDTFIGVPELGYVIMRLFPGNMKVDRRLTDTGGNTIVLSTESQITFHPIDDSTAEGETMMRTTVSVYPTAGGCITLTMPNGYEANNQVWQKSEDPDQSEGSNMQRAQELWEMWGPQFSAFFPLSDEELRAIVDEIQNLRFPPTQIHIEI